MKAILAIWTRELRAYFVSPLAYIVLFFFLVIYGAIFGFIVSYLNDPRSAVGRPLDFFFTFLWYFLLPILAPLLTMRLLAEERGTGSIEVLMTAPVTEDQVVLGKYLGALTFYLFLWLPTVLFAVILRSYSEVDWGPVASGYLGFFLIGALFLSIGLFTSSLTRNQLIAAMICVAALLALTLGPELLGNLIDTAWLKDSLGYLNLIDHQEDFAHGIVDTRQLVLFLSGSAFFLFVTARTLENNKWS